MKELMDVRRREEMELKRAGKKDWKEIATANWRAEIAKLKIRVKEEDLEVGTQEAFDEDDDEEQAKLVDNVFGFLDNASNSSVLHVRPLNLLFEMYLKFVDRNWVLERGLPPKAKTT